MGCGCSLCVFGCYRFRCRVIGCGLCIFGCYRFQCWVVAWSRCTGAGSSPLLVFICECARFGWGSPAGVASATGLPGLRERSRESSKFVEDQTVHGFLPVPGRRHWRYYLTSSSLFPGPYTVPPSLASITLEKVSESRKRSVSLSHSQVSSLETMFSSVCEVTSWLDWWLSTCGGFQEHLTDKAHCNLKRLMLSGSRALEFLGCQVVTALGNHVLSHRDLLLLDVRAMVPAEEVARLCNAALPSSAGLFPLALLDSALDKICAASNDVLVQKTLYPPKIPRKSSAAQSMQVQCPPLLQTVVPRSQKTAQTASSSSAQQGGKWKGRKGKAPFSSASSGSGHSGRKRGGAGKKFSWQGVSSVASGGLPVSALGALACYWGRVLGAGRVSHPLPGLFSSPRSHPDIVSDRPVRISSVTGSGPGDRDVGQGSLGNRPRSGSQLLQSSFSGVKGDGRLVSRDQPLSPERVCSTNTVQDRDRSLRATLPLRGGFPGFHRPERCILPNTRSSGIEEAIEVPVGRGSLPVHSPVLWTVDCPSSLHQGVCSGLCVGSLPWDSS